MQELMRQFSVMFRQITKHDWAWPFMVPVDVEGLGLHDYYQVIEKPMDLGTIKNRMETKDGSEYKNVGEIYADVRLVFKNAMKYNDEGEDVYVMAQSLLQNFEEKWLKLLPKVVEEETRRADEEAEARRNMQLSQDAAFASTAKDLSNELFEIDVYLRNLRQTVVQKCRKMSSDDKRKLGTALSQLSAEDLSKALEIDAQSNPNFQATAQEVDLDIDAQYLAAKRRRADSTLQNIGKLYSDVPHPPSPLSSPPSAGPRSLSAAISSPPSPPAPTSSSPQATAKAASPSLISHLMYSANDQRSQAELLFNLCKLAVLSPIPGAQILQAVSAVGLEPHTGLRWLINTVFTGKLVLFQTT
ncbi:hypothetical protein ACFX2H_012696 [Malus domestica]